MQAFAAHVARLPEQDRSQVRSLVQNGVWDKIAGAGSLTWLPLEVNLACTHAVAATLGRDRAHEFFRSLLLSTFKAPPLQGLVGAVVHKLGKDPGASLFWVARGFDLMFEHCGTWRVIDRTAKQASLQVSGLPFLIASDTVWIQSVASALSALFVIARLEGTATVRNADSNMGRVTFFLHHT